MKIKVATFKHDRGPGRKPFYMAYTRDYNPAWEGCVCFEVEAENGTKAKKLAIKARKMMEGDE